MALKREMRDTSSETLGVKTAEHLKIVVLSVISNNNAYVLWSTSYIGALRVYNLTH